jgi:ankyrin repeat protein
MSAQQKEFKAACKAGDVATVNRLLLLTDPAMDPNTVFLDEGVVESTLVSGLSWACHNGHLAVVDRLLQDERVHPAANGNQAIRHASIEGHVAVVELLLQNGRIDPTVHGNCAIQMASNRGHLAVVERLLQDERVDPSDRGNYAIQLASQNGRSAVVERLLQDKRVDPSAFGNFAIREASSKGHSAVVEYLLQDERVDPTDLHRKPDYLPKRFPVSTLTDAMLPRLALTLSLPFPAESQIILWQPRLREYRQQEIDFLEALIADWQWHRGGLCRDVMDHIVCEYLLGMKLRQFVALDAEYVAPPPLTC